MKVKYRERKEITFDLDARWVADESYGIGKYQVTMPAADARALLKELSRTLGGSNLDPAGPVG